MPLVKVKEKFQVTIPAVIRRRLALKVGDVLEAELEGDRIVLKPKLVLDRSRALERLLSALREGREGAETVPDEEVIEDALRAIEEVRRDRRT